jgi:ribose 5-phosphate isomerase B
MTVKKIGFAFDHRGFESMEKILPFLKSKGYEVVDFGTNSSQSVDYPDFILKAAESITRGTCEKAIGVCYTGIGSSIAANKVKGVRASLVHSVKEAELTRAHNDSNMLILGSGFLPQELLLPIIETWLVTPFEGGRHAERVDKIRQYEQKHCS